MEKAVIEDQIRLYKQGIVFTKFIFRKSKRIDVIGLIIYRIDDIFYIQAGSIPVSNMLLEFVALITDHYYDPVKVKRRKLHKEPVYQRYAIDLHHAFGIVFGKVPKALAHAGG